MRILPINKRYYHRARVSYVKLQAALGQAPSFLYDPGQHRRRFFYRNESCPSENLEKSEWWQGEKSRRKGRC